MINYDDFKPTNIFKKDSKGNDIFLFLFNGFIISDEKKKNKLSDLMGSRYFYFSYRPPMLLMSIFISFIFLLILSFFFDLSQYDNKGLFILFSFPIYLFFLLIYFLRFVFILKGCIKISKEEKDWINQNS